MEQGKLLKDRKSKEHLEAFVTEDVKLGKMQKRSKHKGVKDLSPQLISFMGVGTPRRQKPPEGREVFKN